MQEAKQFLADLLQIDVEYLEEALRSKKRYHRYRKQKLSGGHRFISVPPKPLRDIQRRVLRKILYRIPVRGSYFHGFCPDRSIVTNARSHLERRPSYVLRVDLENAFDRVRVGQFRKHFELFLRDIVLMRELHQARVTDGIHRRYASHVWSASCETCDWCAKEEDRLQKSTSTNLHSLRPRFNRAILYQRNEKFTRLYHAWLGRSNNHYDPRQLYLFPELKAWWKTDFVDLLKRAFELLLEICFHRGSLPQGAPTSPYLLNLAISFSGMPERLAELSTELVMKKAGKELAAGQELSTFFTGFFHLTFYADDITFSSRYSFNERPFAPLDQRTVQGMIVATIEEDGRFAVNRRKTRAYNWFKEHPLVTGLRLTPRGVVLPKKRVQWLRSFIHHAVRDRKLRAELGGHLAFLKMVYGETLPRQLRMKI